MLLTSLLLAPTPALALGGSFVGPLGDEVPGSTATLISLATQEGRTAITVSAQAATGLEDIAWLWPAPGLDSASIQSPEEVGLEGLEIWTRPRVERITCDELIDTIRYRTPPGCASYEVVEPVEPVGEDAVDAVGVRATFIAANPEVAALDPTELDDWLTDRGLGMVPEVRARLDPWLDAGVTIVAMHYDAPISEGRWLPPIRFVVEADEIVLPLVGAAAARSAHELTIVTLGSGGPRITNLDQETLEFDCMLPAATGADAYWATGVDRFRGRPEAPWLSVYDGSAATCDPCTGPTMGPPETAFLGVAGLDLDAATAGRLYVRYIPGQLPIDPVIAFDDASSPVVTEWIERGEGLGFAFPTCGAEADPDDVCPEIQPPTGAGCGSPGAPGLLVTVILGGILWRRRAAGILALLLCAPLAHGSGDDGVSDRRPRGEITASLGLIGTQRVRTEISDRGTPWIGAPLLGIHGRWAALAWRDGASAGLMASLRASRGLATPGVPDTNLRMTLLEPALEIDLRHGTIDAPIAPFVRYGGGIVLEVLDPNVSAPQTAVGVLLHLGAGIVVARGPVRPVFEVRGSVVPRSDGFVTRFRPEVGISDWTWFPGSANVGLHVGVALP